MIVLNCIVILCTLEVCSKCTNIMEYGYKLYCQGLIVGVCHIIILTSDLLVNMSDSLLPNESVSSQLMEYCFKLYFQGLV